jgi:hypothetical protein
VFAAFNTEGIPPRLPVKGSKVTPAGNDGVILYLILPYPPTGVIGLKVVAKVFADIVVEAIALMLDNGCGVTPNIKVAFAPRLLLSRAVTVYVVRDLITVAVPRILPLDDIITNPSGNTGLTKYFAIPPIPPVAVTGVKLFASPAKMFMEAI